MPIIYKREKPVVNHFEDIHKYALDSDGRLVHIDDDSVVRGKKYICPGCSDELIIKRGNVRDHHFAHKSGKSCSSETYLHKCAKHMFKDAFEKNEHLYLKYFVKNHCPKVGECKLHQREHWTDCAGDYLYPFELKGTFDSAEVEKGYNGFIADVLLYNKALNLEPIFIEICYKHPCSKEKVNSGIKIVEVTIQTLNDLKLWYLALRNAFSINECSENDDQKLKVVLYNFNKSISISAKHIVLRYLVRPKESIFRNRRFVFAESFLVNGKLNCDEINTVIPVGFHHDVIVVDEWTQERQYKFLAIENNKAGLIHPDCSICYRRACCIIKSVHLNPCPDFKIKPELLK